ncbi:TIGR03619 family F420-dependent LLM class oxidoreductase [Cellulomonas sp. ES6]|uniref:TIGR03619 family F420-dependent LLM class oxidoreductase n=1 Tax=Cellulomonas sp. ES6 TaxID=3039384 RepID=UPI0024B77665|nr:TIGR03619 family F420-dependent LLM class oxidoreductase [Cellulomonas sp. ES6]WHP16049.1 TIGR03619 family F420-dependent LLM class oxidoreductase [Cellulomonas sp. ES6]
MSGETPGTAPRPAGPAPSGAGSGWAVGAKLPHTGAAATGPAVRAAAVALEAAGFDSLWVSDHVVLPGRVASAYPFASDGVARWPTDVAYLEALVTLTTAAAVTERVRLGTAVLVLPQRQPVLLAKQAASLDALSGGRLVLGVGTGWLREEFAALGVPFDRRGRLATAAIELLRDCWTGRPAGRPDGWAPGAHPLPDDLLVLPAPVRPVPLLVGGHSPAALRRAGTLGDGWLAQQAAPDLDAAALAREVAEVRRHAEQAGRDPAALHVVLRVADSAGRCADVAARVPELRAAGVAEVVVDTDPAGDPAADHALLRAAGA